MAPARPQRVSVYSATLAFLSGFSVILTGVLTVAIFVDPDMVPWGVFNKVMWGNMVLMILIWRDHKERKRCEGQ